MNGELHNITQVGCLSFEVMTVLLTSCGNADRDVCSDRDVCRNRDVCRRKKEKKEKKEKIEFLLT